MTNTRTIFFSYYPFAYNIQRKIFLKKLLKEMYFRSREKYSFCIKMVENIYNFTAFTTFPSKSTIFSAFTAFVAEWPHCLGTCFPHFLKTKNQVNLRKKQYLLEHIKSNKTKTCIGLALVNLDMWQWAVFFVSQTFSFWPSHLGEHLVTKFWFV